MGILKYSEFINESNREEYIKKYCKESPAIPQVSMSFKNIHEYFTSGFEKWADGKYNGDSKIVKYFEQFRDWIIDTYEKLGGKITPNVQMRKLYEICISRYLLL